MGSILSQERKEHPKFQFPKPTAEVPVQECCRWQCHRVYPGYQPSHGTVWERFCTHMLVVLCGSLSEFQINPVALSMPVTLVLCKCGYITSGLILVPNQFYFLMPEPRNSAALKLLGDKPV